MNNKIDIIVPWVDGDDPNWLKEKQYWMERCCTEKASNPSVRYESWDLRYWFRAIEKFMPWFNRIIFVTWGHVPEFLNIEHPRLVVVKHSDYIPKEYLPTFNSNVIELNYHRIEQLSENFILFNDDFFPIKPIKETHYFRNDMVCEEAIERIVTVVNDGPQANIHRIHILNNLLVINRNFKKREVQKKNFWKWYYPGYGSMLIKTFMLQNWDSFSGFWNAHLPVAMKKSTLEHLWKIEPNVLKKTSGNKFREISDVTQYLIRYWQLCEGNFWPSRRRGHYYTVNINNYKQVADEIAMQKHPVICLNEKCTPEEFLIIRKEISTAFEKILPEKSSFEK